MTATSFAKMRRRSRYGLTRASGSCSALTLLLTSLGHDSGSASDSVPRRWHGGYFWAWCLVRQWIHGLRQLLGAFGWFSMFSTHLEMGHYVHEPLVSLAVPVRCLVYSWRNAWFDYGYMFCIIQGGFWKNFRLSLRDWVSRLLRSILRPGRHVVDKGSGTFFIGFAGLMPLAQCSHDSRQSTDRCFSCSRVALGNLGIISTSPCVSA